MVQLKSLQLKSVLCCVYFAHTLFCDKVCLEIWHSTTPFLLLIWVSLGLLKAFTILLYYYTILSFFLLCSPQR